MARRLSTAAIVVHGGAGSDELLAKRRTGVRRACDAGWAVLQRGGSALDAAVAAVVVMEDDPAFNAGRGSVLTLEGHVEMDASVMDGTTLHAGAVGIVRRVANPVRLARVVMERGKEVLFVGPPADRLGRTAGLRTVPPSALVTPATRRWWTIRRAMASRGDTVGAVVCDGHGHVAAATSTGGLPGKRAGRIGDSAVIGAGTYADDRLGAGSATGPGEAIIRTVMTRMALERMEGTTPTAAARAALAELRRATGARAGVILVDPRGRIGIARTTVAMPVAWRNDRSRRTTVVA